LKRGGRKRKNVKMSDSYNFPLPHFFGFPKQGVKGIEEEGEEKGEDVS
jgi:hypothetical protein